ncbi:hypothetical protein E8E14_012407 [Neopestalotiopsis sp. 37M]|nr:hypothetical protein E8E14_012407 [Neopestalotiopsis sp. 37M]
MALAPESEMAWTVSENCKADARIVSLGGNMTGRVQGKSLTIHSAALSGLLRDTIKIYPGQNLTGDTLVFQEPYAALMHHMSDLETAYSDMNLQEEQSTTEHAQSIQVLGTLLEFLRPEYQAFYVPAQKRISQEQPAVMFDNLWILFKADSPAYAKVDDYWLGCKISAATKSPGDPEKGIPGRWDIAVWLLRTDWSAEQIGCATHTYQVFDFEGERSPMNFDIIPCHLYDSTDGGSRRKRFEERGRKALGILQGPSMECKYDGKVLAALKRPSRSYIGFDGIPLQFPKPPLKGNVLLTALFPQTSDKSIWNFPFADVDHLLPKDDPAYRISEAKIKSKNSDYLFTDIMCFMLSPCLSAVNLLGADLLLIHVDYLQPLISPKRQLINLMSQFETIVFMSSREAGDALIANIQPHVNLTIAFSALDYKRQGKLWLNIMDMYGAKQETGSEITFERTVSSFLSSADMPKVNWNGHDITKCLETAILLAQLAANSSHSSDKHNSVLVKVEHIKKAMNTAYGSRLAMDSALRSLLPADRNIPRPPVKGNDPGQDDTSEDDLVTFERFHEYDELSDDESPPMSPKDGKPQSSITLLAGARSRKRWLCVAELNKVEWSTFKTLGTTELFRSKRFHAIDVLVGEPQIWRELPSLVGRKRRIAVRSVAPQPAIATASRHQNTADSAMSAVLPERIRVNSPAIIKAFSELQIDDTSNSRGSFLLFRPYKVLSYHEKDLREWTKTLEEKMNSGLIVHQHYFQGAY